MAYARHSRLLLVPCRASFWMPSPLTLFATRSRIFRTHKSLNKRACRAFIITSVWPGRQPGKQASSQWDNQTGGIQADPSPLSSASSAEFIAIICNCSAKIEFEVSPRHGSVRSGRVGFGTHLLYTASLYCAPQTLLFSST